MRKCPCPCGDDSRGGSLKRDDMLGRERIVSALTCPVPRSPRSGHPGPAHTVVIGYRDLAEVPCLIQRHWYRNYAPLWSNVWIYAPQVMPSDSDVNLLFTDVYTIEVEHPHPVKIDGQSYPPKATLELRRGRHSIATTSRLRLKLRVAQVDHLLNSAYQYPTWFFGNSPGLIPYPANRGIWVDD